MWVGVFDYKLNFRDVGESLNQCLNKDVFRTGLVFRSNKYFSGWSCDRIGNPQKIYTLNFEPHEPHDYYCKNSDGSEIVGVYTNTTFEIQAVENLNDWERPEFRQTMCTLFRDTLDDIIEERNFLFHCSAGRDRTGAFAAMFSTMLAEQKEIVDEKFIDALECDYQKTSSLKQEKYGHIKLFIEDMQKSGGVSKFIETKCGIDPATMRNAADHFIQ
ncbi:hypothetical protein FACS189487_06490 [Campylobacterota bacterium]|nr:hypothetical protein FACS189487_06490 [Campylobacterota bacterium]